MAAFDLKIVNGTVYDGSGRPGVRTNVGVRDGRIVEVGPCEGAATRTIDAEGAIVTPGFVDVHTHYDGQISWDSDMLPSSVHGVTTAVLGNCGVGFAPVHKHHHETLVRLMEGVEDIPGAALAEGVTWKWETFPEYMSAIDAVPHTIDFALQVPHDALRVYVMGDRALRREPATAEDIEKMRAIVRESLEQGAAGFTLGRTNNHRDASGQATPSSEAELEELVGIAKAFHGLSHGVIQAVSDFDMEDSAARFDPEFDLLEKMLAAADGHPMAISWMQRDLDAEQWKRIRERAEKVRAKGDAMRLVAAARPIGVLLGFEATFQPFMGYPSYKAIAHLPLEERVRVMRDPAFKAKLLSEKTERVAGDGSPIPPLADRMLENIDFVSMRIFRLGERPNYEPPREESMFAESLRRNVSPLEVIYDALLENDGRELLYLPIYNYLEFSLDVVHQMLTHPQMLPGLSDGGAHVGTVCDASFPTYMLMHWARDRAHGRIPLERVVQMMTADTARFMGFHDRGLIEVGKRADLNVIDHAKLSLDRPRLVRDLPANGKRLLQDAHGYRATILGGVLTVENDALTGARPGRLVRAGRT